MARDLMSANPDGLTIPPVPDAAGGAERTVVLVRGLPGMQGLRECPSPTS